MPLTMSAMQTQFNSFEDKVQTVLVPCRICGAAQYKNMLTADNPRRKTRRQFTVVQCNDCGFRYINPTPDNESLKLYYENYEAHQPKKIGKLESLYYWLLRSPVKMKAPGKLLDIGCGNGKYLDFMRSRGWDVTGLDRADGCRFPREALGLTVLDGNLWEQNIPSNTYDLITIWWVIEHVMDPKRLLDECFRILKPSGQIILSTINNSSIEAQYFGRYWWHLLLPEHISQFEPHSLKRIVKQSGFEVFHFMHEPVTCGFIGSIQNYLDEKHVKVNVNNLFFKLLFIPVELLCAVFQRSGFISVYGSKR